VDLKEKGKEEEDESRVVVDETGKRNEELAKMKRNEAKELEIAAATSQLRIKQAKLDAIKKKHSDLD
jgi:hypothetical protein